MADKIRNFFKKKTIEKQFKKAGPGHKLSDESSSGGSARPAAAPVAGSSHGAQGRPAQPSESAARAGAAALARLSAQKDVNFSLSAIRAQAMKELELEKQQQAEQAARAESMKSQVPHQHKEVPPQLAKDGSDTLLFRCPMMGPQALPKKELREEMHKFLVEQLEEERGLSAALIIVTCNDDKGEPMVQGCVDTLCKILGNVIDNPDNAKYRKIKLTNKKFQEAVLPIVGAVEFLEAAGFVKQHLEDGEDYLVLGESADIDSLPVLRDALICAEPMEIVLDRNTRVLLPSQASRESSVSDDLFSLTPDELAREQAARTREAELRTQLRTKAMRERDAKRESLSYTFTCIRIRLPNGVMLQGTFQVTDKLSEVMAFLRESLVDSLANSHIVLKNGTTALASFDETLLDLKLFPAVVLNCIVTDAPASCDFLRPELVALVEHMSPS